MQPVAPPPAAAGAPRAGRGQVIAGVVLIAVSVVVGVVATGYAGSRFDPAALERDVSFDGPGRVIVPGEVRFEVLEPISGEGSSTLSVGIGVASRSGPAPDCTLRTDAGEVVPTQQPLQDATLLADTEGEFDLLAVARLDPGAYVAECAVAGEPSTSRVDAEMTVGRTFGFDDVGEVAGPLLWFVAGIGVAGVLLVVGVILLIVGLVRGSRARSGAGAQHGGWPPADQPPAQWQSPPGQWQPPPGQWQPPPGQWSPPPGQWSPPPGQWQQPTGPFSPPAQQPPAGWTAPPAPVPGEQPAPPTAPQQPPAPPVPSEGDATVQRPTSGWTVPEPKGSGPTWRPPGRDG